METKNKKLNRFIRKWVTKIAKPQKKLNGHSICPFASYKTKIKYIEVSEDIDYIDFDFTEAEVMFLCFNDDVSEEFLKNKCTFFSKKYEHLVFLSNHRKRKTYINGIQTNDINKNLILCQDKNKLLKAREALNKTDYYSFWSEEYLKEILGK